MTLNILDKIGDWNPQLFREMKGRLKLFNITSLSRTFQPTITMLLALLGQLIILAFLNLQLSRTIKSLGESATKTL